MKRITVVVTEMLTRSVTLELSEAEFALLTANDQQLFESRERMAQEVLRMGAQAMFDQIGWAETTRVTVKCPGSNTLLISAERWPS